MRLGVLRGVGEHFAHLGDASDCMLAKRSVCLWKRNQTILLFLFITRVRPYA